MSKTSIPVIKFLFKDELKVLSDALNIGPGFEIEEFANSNDLSTYLSSVPAGLVVTSLYDRNDLIQIATFMKLGKKVAKDCAVKVVVFNFSKDRNFEKAIAKLGILDIVEPNINTKALKFKIDFWMKSLKAQVKNNVAFNPQKVKSLEQNKASDKKSNETSVINWIEPLELEDDIWLLKHENDCKKVLSKWLLRLLGPSPYVGQWVEVKAGLWRFDMKESEKDLYLSSEGSWFFSGDQRPEFVWKENIWLISGDNFDLFFKGTHGVSSRLNCKNRAIYVCKNSEFAKTKEQTIIDSFDKELVFRRGADVLEDLEGKNKTDEIDGGPLSGKSKTPADRTGNLTGKLEKPDEIKHENLEQKTGPSREKTHWNNKNSYEEEAKGSLGVNTEKHRDGANLERENKDQEHKKYYKNHNEAENYEAGELGQGLHGKSSTDQISSHYDSSKSAQGDSSGPELSGKGETDKLKSHYGRKENTGTLKENESKGPDGKSSEAEAKERAEKAQREAKSSGDKESGDKSGAGPTADREENLSSRNESHEPHEPKNTSGVGDKAAHGLSRKPDEDNRFKDTSILQRRKKDEGTAEASNREAEVYPLDKAREEKNKQKTAEEKALDKLTENAKVSSTLTFNDRNIQCSLDDFFDETIIFHTDSSEITEASAVKLDLKFKFLEKETQLKINGDVLTVEGDGEGKNFVTVQLSKENAVAFDTFMKLYKIRQDNVTEFLKRAKGY